MSSRSSTSKRLLMIAPPTPTAKQLTSLVPSHFEPRRIHSLFVHLAALVRSPKISLCSGFDSYVQRIARLKSWACMSVLDTRPTRRSYLAMAHDRKAVLAQVVLAAPRGSRM